ncbi:MAG: HEPN domain-containing protein [Planctomycetes bacterium]|nr:HEPN domain-containing protein [Planctomycetota bacterium]
MSLQDWANFGWLKAHQTSPQEITDMLAGADSDLRDCQTVGLSPGWRLNIAYNAALRAAAAALAAAGFRPARGESHHARVIQSLEHTIQSPREIIDRFDAFRRKRNITDYERIGTVSQQEAAEMLELARKLRLEVEAWLRAFYPHLLPR